jgi:hypothetical protein
MPDGRTKAGMEPRKIPHSAFWIVAFTLAGIAAVSTAAPLDTATVTRVQNKAVVAEVNGDQASAVHPAAISEVLKANNLLQTAATARAELQFNDGSLVRVGPNTVFSFNSKARTLSLEKGDMLFYLPPGRDGVKIKTASLTAAITGTVVLIKVKSALCLAGKFKLTYIEDGKEKAIELEGGTDHNAAKWVNGRLEVYQSDASDPLWGRALEKLTAWAGAPLPDGAEREIALFSPWVKDAAEGDEFLTLYDQAGVGFDSSATQLANRALAATATARTITGVLPCGRVGIFDSFGKLLGLR